MPLGANTRLVAIRGVSAGSRLVIYRTLSINIITASGILRLGRVRVCYRHAFVLFHGFPADLSILSSISFFFLFFFPFLYFCRFVFMLSLELVDVTSNIFLSADHVPDWQPRILPGMVEARSVQVKKHTHTHTDWLPAKKHPPPRYILHKDGMELSHPQPGVPPGTGSIPFARAKSSLLLKIHGPSERELVDKTTD